jgi:hypothetical protein
MKLPENTDTNLTWYSPTAYNSQPEVKRRVEAILLQHLETYHRTVCEARISSVHLSYYNAMAALIYSPRSTIHEGGMDPAALPHVTVRLTYPKKGLRKTIHIPINFDANGLPV